MSQNIVYKNAVWCIYRGGFDEKSGRGLDKFDRNLNPYEKHEFCFNPGIQDGFLLYIHNKEAFKKFFNIIWDKENKDYFPKNIETNLKIVFDGHRHIILYFGKDPKRFEKTYKTATPTVKQYIEYIYLTNKPYKVKGWKFSHDNYILLDFEPNGLFELIPEYLPKNWSHYSYQEKMSFLFNLDPIDLNDSWDYTDEEKEHIKIKKLEKEQEAQRKREELEKRKQTPGYCSVCGNDQAEFIPFEEAWLCADCYYNR